MAGGANAGAGVGTGGMATKLRAAPTEHMTMLENTPERVRKYFGDKHVAYAAS